MKTDDGASAKQGRARLKYTELQLSVDVGFWTELRDLKLTEWKLTELYAPIVASLRTNIFEHTSLVPTGMIHLDKKSFHPGTIDSYIQSSSSAVVTVSLAGSILNFNLVEKFNELNSKNALLSVLVNEILSPALSKQESCESQAAAWSAINFAQVVMYTYIDAKNYRFYHREATPTLSVDSAFIVEESIFGLSECLPFQEGIAEQIHEHSVALLRAYPQRNCNPFLCHYHDDTVTFEELSPKMYTELQSAGNEPLLCFFDFSDALDGVCLPIRNVLYCLHFALPSIISLNVYAVRAGGPSHSLFMRLSCEPLDVEFVKLLQESVEDAGAKQNPSFDWVDRLPFLKVSGWRKKKPELIDLSSMINPVARADADSRFNLDLMKWRVLPTLELKRIAACKALLLGSGTLGCNVARNLLMWGVRHITLVDRGRVAFSNLARQSLFSFEDAKEKRYKTEAASAALQNIIPSVVAEPITMTIHMPGHRIDVEKTEEVLTEINTLVRLIKESDVVFLLTDSREARWIPTLVAAAHGVPIINTALGFDTYVVMRHGVPSPVSLSNAVGNWDASSVEQQASIGCYFCSDVVAPTDSLSFRALDEQCTVTRPAVSSIASAIAVDLLAQVYQHPQGFRCAAHRGAELERDDSNMKGRLGILPQQIRGSVFYHSVSHLYGERNTCCSACSDAILNAYREGGAQFLLRCVNDPMYIEDICGVTALKASWEARADDMQWDSDEDYET